MCEGVEGLIDRPTETDPGARGAPVGGAPGGDAADEEAMLARRLSRLGESLEAHKSADEAAKTAKKPAGFAQATKIASEFVAGIVVGAAIGWGIDKAAGTSPWALIVFLLLGFAAGVLNVLRSEGVVADAGARLRDEAGRGRGFGSDRHGDRPK
jgi:ATP synthase protein I